MNLNKIICVGLIGKLVKILKEKGIGRGLDRIIFLQKKVPFEAKILINEKMRIWIKCSEMLKKIEIQRPLGRTRTRQLLLIMFQHFNLWLIIMIRQLFKQLIINFERLVVASKAGSLTKLYKQTSPETMA